MMLVEVVYVLARDDVDLAVPVAIECVESLELLLLPVRQAEILVDELHSLRGIMMYMSAAAPRMYG